MITRSNKPSQDPESIKRKRDLAARIMGQGPLVAPRSTLDGLGNAFDSIMGGIATRRMNSDADTAEQAGRATTGDLRQRFIDRLTGGSSFPAAPNPGNTTSMAAEPAPDYASARVAQAHGNNIQKNDLRGGIIATAEAIGADPVDLATAISYETAGTFDPLKRGPTTQWGQHRGLIQFGEPQARQHGVDWDDPLNSQLGPDGAVASYFRSSGFQPGMSGLDLYSTINAGAPGRYNRSDANNGGAPGNVRDKWENQMGGHRRKAQQLIGDYQPGQAQAMQTESTLTPEALQQWAFANMGQQQPMPNATPLDAVNALGSAQPVPVAETEDDIVAQEAMMAGQSPMAFAPQAAGTPAPPMPAPQMVQDNPMPPQQPMQIAQAGGLPEMAGQAPQAIPAPQGPDMQMLLQVMSDPFMDEGTKAFAQAQLQQQMQANDPMRQLQMERAQLENAALRNPKPDLTTGQREYQMATQQGYRGTFMDYKRDLAEAQRQQTNISIGSDGAPELGKLSTDYGYVLDPETRQPVIDPATGLPQSAPVPGSPAARAIAESQRMQGEREGQGQRYGRIVGEDIGRVLDAVEKNPNLVAGPIGSMLSQLPGTGAHDVSSMLGTIRANVGFDRLQAMRSASPTGGALGAVSDSENRMLQATLGALEQSQSPDQFARNLKRLQNIYTEIVHGPAPDGVSDDDWTKQSWGVPTPSSRKTTIGGYTIEQVD